MGQEKVAPAPSLTDVAKVSSNTSPAKPSKVYSIHGGGGKPSSTVQSTSGGPASAEGAATAGIDTSRKATSGTGGDTNSVQVARPAGSTGRVNTRPIGGRR